ncbi:hypothetical protein A3K86_19645 [Photobacterium jeanii]|uniref:Uncharacterized protein n=1 Tax=Photobacterium jeanii TaxID=858640 RepID=A0A178K243_9GAMM|nr:hypothetical protein [Photobacterium jeanii]OAN11177.1 hypothetical protein A3K86_19645 [Photobacterium jeanii]PST90696.1 hypothetical protein C9I91_08745 [Photobacterium jeanii]
MMNLITKTIMKLKVVFFVFFIIFTSFSIFASGSYCTLGDINEGSIGHDSLLSTSNTGFVVVNTDYNYVDFVVVSTKIDSKQSFSFKKRNERDPYFSQNPFQAHLYTQNGRVHNFRLAMLSKIITRKRKYKVKVEYDTARFEMSLVSHLALSDFAVNYHHNAQIILEFICRD